MKMRTISTLAATAALLAGCRSAPIPPSATDAWVPTRETQATDWVWKEVRAGTTNMPTGALALPELADIALQNNPASRKAWNDARAAAAQVEFAKGYFIPALTATAGGSRQVTSADPGSFDQDFTKYGPGLQLNYLVLNFGGGRKAAVEQALQSVYAADFTFNRTIQDVLLAVETAYYAFVGAKSGVVAAETSVKDAQTTLEAAQARLAAGVGTELEILQARSSLDQRLYGLASASGQVNIARGMLAQAMGIPADTPLQVAEPSVEMPSSIPKDDISRRIDEAMKQRPDIAALRATVASRQAAVRVAGAALWPSLYVNGAASLNYFDTNAGKDMQDNDWSYGGGVSVQWPIFDGFQTVNEREIARAQADAARAQLAQAELAASADVWVRFNGYATAVQKYEYSAASLASATAAYNLALDSYKSGLRSILDLLGAESLLAQARSLQITSRQEVFAALAELAHSLGLLSKGGSTQIQNLFSTTTQKDPKP
jgi:outer membrane protein